MKELAEEMRSASLQWGQRENQLVARIDLLTALLDSCYDAICNAVYDEDGLDGAKGVELLEKIKETIGMVGNVRSWEPEHNERKSQFCAADNDLKRFKSEFIGEWPKDFPTVDGEIF